MNISRSLIAASLLMGLAQTVTAQTADDIIEKHLAAMGGRAALEKITSRTMAGTVTVSTPGGDVSGPIEVIAQAPNKSRTLIRLDLSSLGAGQMVVDQRFDGTAGYVLDTLQGNRDLSGSQLEAMKNNVFPSPYLKYKEAGTTVELSGKQKLGDREAYLLILKPKSGPVARQYIDADSYLAVRSVIKVDVPQIGGELEQTTELLDYREVDGVKVAFQIKTLSAVQTATIVITKVEQNTTLDQTQFAKP
jgi:outer membrane lipoprotein-sorting protein